MRLYLVTALVLAFAVAALLGYGPGAERGTGFLQVTSTFETDSGDTYVVGSEPAQRIEGGGYIDVILNQTAQTVPISLHRHGFEILLCNVDVAKGRIASVSLQKTYRGTVCSRG